MILVDKKSQIEVERTILGKKKSMGTINRWIREYIVKTNKRNINKIISTAATVANLSLWRIEVVKWEV